ncbi:hypothetical protein TRAPUB_1743 [Trametes pubescens]|uniref:Uncharacterized protein n=1 Tax=Trametes pubescens TaxID=154538 RepID=A0A1M2VIR4_TRAPU|nr:hypothetical protein TRAPUB_1743 [Trametes pubescens]
MDGIKNIPNSGDLSVWAAAKTLVSVPELFPTAVPCNVRSENGAGLTKFATRSDAATALRPDRPVGGIISNVSSDVGGGGSLIHPPGARAPINYDVAQHRI